MKKRHVYFGMLMIAALSLTVMQSCDKEPDELLLESMVATGDIDLNAATAPTNVPTIVVITASFNTDIDPATVTSANVTLTQDYDNADIPVSLSVTDNTVTVTPDEELSSGALYQLTFSSGVTTLEGLALTELTRSFTTAGTFAPTGVIAHWNFEDNADDQVGDFSPGANQVVAITYTDSRNAAAGKAATFDGDASIIEIPNGDDLMNTSHFTISFWVKTNSEGHEAGHFVMGLGAHFGFQYEIYGGYDGSKFAISYEVPDQEDRVSEDMWFPTEAKDNTHEDGWMGTDFAKSLTAEEMIALLKDNWLHVTYTFDGTAKAGTLYFNGEKMKSFDFNLWPEEDVKRTVTGMNYMGTEPEVVNELAFGFIQSRGGTLWANEPWGGYDFPDANHFKGQLDDIRIFHKALSSTEVQLMYDSEK
jgi:hypothetical protein